jgi:hypothetical protein
MQGICLSHSFSFSVTCNFYPCWEPGNVGWIDPALCCCMQVYSLDRKSGKATQCSKWSQMEQELHWFCRFGCAIDILPLTGSCHVIINPLMPELNPSAKSCLPRFFNGDLIFKGLTARRLYKSFSVKGLSPLYFSIPKYICTV